ncbi:MAG: DNA repair protein RadA [Oscillospiraceae bacterium]|jgi:DNA repair protein RadA/Sms|nr:DNA repair protein RadA [Oscillospiraceae bacterium]
MKLKQTYRCAACGYETPRWLGKCPGCGEWNSLEEVAPEPIAPPGKRSVSAPRSIGVPGLNAAVSLSAVTTDSPDREPIGMPELDRVLGGGIVPGSLLLLGGDPGVGKSTLLLQASHRLAVAGKRVLYVSGEESARQIKLRARRLDVDSDRLFLLTETNTEAIAAQFDIVRPDAMVVDSIQTMASPDAPSMPGSVSQVRACAAVMAALAKSSGCAVFLVGHVTKDGAIAGPRVLEHMVDAVLYFEGERRRAYRMLRAVKNRFGSVQELGLFEMTERGMAEVGNPEAMLLSQRAHGVSGSVVTCAIEGTRPLLVDVQALVARSPLASPRRTVDGVDAGRVALLLAVLEKRAGLRLYDQDVFINIAGGLTLSEPAADLALTVAVASSLKNIAVSDQWVVFGEVGLAGEARGVPLTERRLAECARLGFTHAIAPKASLRGVKVPESMRVVGVESVREALGAIG